jgi:regulatory protein
MLSGDGQKLARVTYLPGVIPAPALAEPSPESDQPAAVDASVLPDFVSFFGGTAFEGPASGATAGSGSGAESADSGAADLDAPDSDDADPDAADSDDAGTESASADSTDSGIRGARREVRAENVSMHALTRRGMSRWELQKTLLSRELDPDVVEAELERLERVGLLDDAALAETFVRTQHERKGLGRGAITAELRRRHVDQEHIEAALEQVDDDDEQTRANELALKRAGQLSSYDLETAKRRLYGFLARKGYSSGVVRVAVDSALSARSSGVRFR